MKKDENNTKKRKFNTKGIIKGIVIFLVGLIIGIGSSGTGSGVTQEKYDSLNSKYEKVKEKNKTLQAKVDEAKPWFEMSEQEKQNEQEKVRQEKEELAQEKEKKEKEEQAAKEAKEKKEQEEKEAKEKQGYDTGITYSQLARTPDDYQGEKIKFNGEVIQVLEQDGQVQIRLAVNGDYDNIILCQYDSSIVKSRVLENDNITVYGTSLGLITYESTLGGDITIPSMMVDKIDN